MRSNNQFTIPYEFNLEESSREGLLSSFSSSTDLENMYEIRGAKRPPKVIKYLVHTSTIPYAHIWNIGLDDRPDGIYHSVNCSGCMMNGRPMKISPKCPCLDTVDFEVEEVCFLSFIRTFNKGISITELTCPEAEPSEFAFCKDSMNIFSHKYNGPMRRKLGITGFDKVDSFQKLHKVLSCLYWYKFSRDIMERCFAMHEKNFPNFLKSVKHTIYTINGLITKIFLIACEFDYKLLAKRTAALFDDLLFDYSKRPNISGAKYEPVEEKDSVFLQIKGYLNYVKTWFNRPEREQRIRVLQYPFTFKSVEDFISMILEPIETSMTAAYMLEGTDYSDTLSWSYRMTELLQTRNLGYLPRRIAILKNQEYREHLDTRPVKPDDDLLVEIVNGINRTLSENKIPNGLFDFNPEDFDPEISKILDETLQEVDVPIKFSASYQNILKDGGRLEDARQVVEYCVEKALKLPIRDLFTNSIKGVVDCRSCRSESTICFWFSYECCIRAINNEMKKLKQPPIALEEEFYIPSHYIENFFKAKILHIQEPGKQRNLVKSTSVLTWFLSLASKMTQAILSRLPDHRVGLTGSADAWKFQQKIHPAHNAGSFFDLSGRLLQSCFVYSDWVEATDYIPKLIGLRIFRAFSHYIAFPKAYGKLLEFTITWPQPVEETVSIYEDETVSDRTYHGYIRSGFMMGNPLTKTILHLMHVAEYGISLSYFEKKNIQIRQDSGRLIPHIESSKKFVDYLNQRQL